MGDGGSGARERRGMSTDPLRDEHDPYRCPICGAQMARDPWRCPTHGERTPTYVAQPFQSNLAAFLAQEVGVDEVPSAHLVEALRFYANPANYEWRRPSHEEAPEWSDDDFEHSETSAVLLDDGARARAALKEQVA